MKLRSDYRAAVLMKNRLHHESGEPIEEPIHPGQQRRIQQGREVFSEGYFSSYSWFRLQSIGIHRNRRCLWTEHLHSAFFSHVCTCFILVHTSHCGSSSRCRTTCLHKTCSSTCHHMSERLLFPCFVFFLCLSCPYVLSHFYPFSVLNFDSHDVENAEH